MPARTFWVATLETRHFDFDAYGATEAEARTALVAALNIHARQYQVDAAGMYHPDDINARRVTLGHGYRDAQQISPKD